MTDCACKRTLRALDAKACCQPICQCQLRRVQRRVLSRRRDENTGERCSPVSYQSSRAGRPYDLVWRRRRPLELRMLPARSRRRTRTRRTQRAHSVSRKGPRFVPPLLRWRQTSTQRARLKTGAANFACCVMHCGHGDGNRLIARYKTTRCEKMWQCNIKSHRNSFAI